MTDRYIDLDETGKHGAHAAAELEKLEKKHKDAFHGLALAVKTPRIARRLLAQLGVLAPWR